MLVERGVIFRVNYKGENIGTYMADMVVENSLIIALKAITAEVSSPQIAQCLNYMKASGLKKGLVINFGRLRLNVRRVVL